MRLRFLAPILTLALLALPAAAAPAKSARKHPPVKFDPAVESCASCHTDATPQVTKDWETGAHGVALVKCMVCHGSTGKDFTLAPPAQRCQGCHPAEVASIAARGKSKKARSCFDCHAPHTLAATGAASNPHAR
jgi:hypothetical protein